MSNRLALATSPYLLQHKDNPVDWWPWTPEALAEAERRQVPVLLSVGYAACHWCHVMAHESFEDAATAAYMNEHFVCIKVDREERPDVDAVYMEATTAMTGQGGWPMTCFLTPAAQPFYCGTYFPPIPRYGTPSFGQLMSSVVEAWTTQREQVLEAGAHIVAQLAGQQGAASGSGELTPTLVDDAVALLAKGFDAVRGGFGSAPKFPPSMVLEWLLRHAARTGDAQSLQMVERTCEAMARGGLYDQLAGGFARYSTDDSWVVPHFEKMLYDNALLLRVYCHLWRQTTDPVVRDLARRVAVDTADFLVRDLRTPEGGFASALDADTEGVEGRFYVWTPHQLVDALGQQEGQWAAELYGVTQAGSFEHGSSVLQLPADSDDPARETAVRLRLLQSRAERVAPARDDKVVAAWNGLAIAGLVEAGVLFGRPDLVDAAISCAELLVRLHVDGGRLLRTSRDGSPGNNAGVLEDHGDVAEGLLVLASATSDARWVSLAGELLGTVLDHFSDGAGGFFDTADDAETLIRRPQDPTDNATPSGAAAVTAALLSYAALTGSGRHRHAAEVAMARLTPLIAGYPRFAGWAGAAAEAMLAGPAEVAIVGDPADTRTQALVTVAWRAPSPGAVIAVGDPAQSPYVELLAGRQLVDGGPTAYVCRRMVCRAPVTTPESLAEDLARR
ncbi:MAG: uncharacterized protein QOI76_1750 [Frankiales bacterium]|nr:uncharacterized protein [Frankiales bacterium]